MQRLQLIIAITMLPIVGWTQVIPTLPDETSQMEPLIGKWSSVQEILSRTGEWKKAKAAATWEFEWGLKGHAVIDKYELVHKDQSGRDSVDFSGINIRIYDPKDGKWKITWLENVNRKFASFTAEMVNGEIAMEGKTVAKVPVKIYFYELKENSFLWRQERTFDGGKSWIPVARMKCTRI